MLISSSQDAVSEIATWSGFSLIWLAEHTRTYQSMGESQNIFGPNAQNCRNNEVRPVVPTPKRGGETICGMQ